jgi:hypothetical protein
MTESPTENHPEAVRSLLAFWNDHYWDSARLLAQGWAFYLTIIAALVGFVTTRTLPNHIGTGLLAAAMLITAAHMCGAMLWAWGLMKLVATIEALHRELDAALFHALGTQTLFRRWRVVGALVTACSLIISVIIFAGLGLLCWSSAR